jgi:hypothetical protein
MEDIKKGSYSAVIIYLHNVRHEIRRTILGNNPSIVYYHHGGTVVKNDLEVERNL